MFGHRKEMQPPADPRISSARESLGRILMLKIALLLFFLVVAVRLIQIQVLDAGTYQEIAQRQYEAKIVLPATRGSIYDRDGRILVSNTMYVSFGADPKILGSYANLVAEWFARVFNKAKSFYLEKLSAREKRFVWLERRVRPTSTGKISAEQFEGLIQMNEPVRLSHYDHLAGQVIGFTDVDNNGLAGVELECDRHLKGLDGYIVMQRDGLGRRRPSVDYPRVDPVNGKSVTLTIDREYQAIAEEELAKGIERNKAEGGLVVILDPVTGELLALANYPFLNPNTVPANDQSVTKNRIISDMFEPGSMFKIVTVGAALEHGLVKPEQKFFAERGSYVVKLAGGKSRTIADMHPYGMLTIQEAMEVSSNIVMAKVSERIGAERLYTTARNFGFGASTGVELSGEVCGELKKPNQWSGTTLNTMSYGYEVGVTALQIAAAYAAIANDGVLMKPFVVKNILDEQNEVIAETRPQPIRRVITKRTAETLTQFLTGVVERGTGVHAKLGGLSIAGKTGTARKFLSGKYQPGSYTASFAGFFPAEDPKIVCVVMIDNPRAGGYTGSLISAPIFKAIAAKLRATSSRFHTNENRLIVGKQRSTVPDVTSLTVEAAASMLVSQGFEVETTGKGKVVIAQSPGAGSKALEGKTVTMDTDRDNSGIMQGFAVVPDVTGLTIRRAITRLTMDHLEVAVEGSGVVAAQRPEGGAQVKRGTRVALRCAPKSLAPVHLY